MPTIITRGVASARGAGTFSAAPPPLPPPPPSPTPPPPPPPGPVLQTVVFTSSGSWTAPSGVTSISNINIAGGRYVVSGGISIYDPFLTIAISTTRGTEQPGSPTAFYTYAQAGALGDSVIAQLNAGAPAERFFSNAALRNVYNQNTGGFYNEYEPANTGFIRGFVSPAQGPWDNRTNEISLGNGQSWVIGGERYFPPSETNGTPSSAFGFTVEGGTEGNPSPNGFFGSISVIPGQTYQIIVGTPSSNDSSTPAQVNFQFVQG